MDSHILMINVTADQEATIKCLFKCKGWKYDKTGTVPLQREDIQQKRSSDKSSDLTTRNSLQCFTQPYLREPSQFVESCQSAPGVLDYGSCDRYNTNTNSNVLQYHTLLPVQLDNGTSVSNLGNTQEYYPSPVADHTISKSLPHNEDHVSIALSDVRNKQYSPNNHVASYLDKERDHIEGVSAPTLHTSVLQQAVTYNSSKNDDTRSSNNIEIGKSDINIDYQQNKSENTDNIKDEIIDTTEADQFNSIDETVSSESVKDEEVSKNAEYDASIDLDKCISVLTEVSSDVDNVGEKRFQKCVKLLIDKFDVIFKFLKNVLKLETDRKLILPLLKEILEVAKYINNEKFFHDSIDKLLTEIDINPVKREFDEKHSCYRNYKNDTETQIKLYENSDGETDEEENESDLDENINIPPSKTCNDMIALTDIKDEDETKHSSENIEIENFKSSTRSESTKWIKFEVLNSPEKTHSSLDHKSRLLLETVSDEDRSNKSMRYNLKCNKRCRAVKKGKIVNANKRKSNETLNSAESVKYRWTVSRNLRMHKYHRKCATVPTDLDANNYSVVEKGFYCPDCQFIFKGKSKLNLHKQLKNGYCLPDCIYCDAEQEKDVFQCSKCPKCFQTEQMLERHQEKHTLLLKCHLCSLEFYAPNDVKLHFQTEHAEKSQPTYLCDLCGAKFKERKVLNAHRRFVHSNERPEVCNYCEKRFKTKSQLKNHLITHKQASELNLSCEICGKMFLRAATLKDHVRRHKKEFSCYCTICNKGFYRRYSLEEHMRVHTGDKPFDCKFCGFKCALSCNLVKHMKIHQKHNVG